MKQELENKRPDSEERRSIWQRWKQNLKDWVWFCKEHPDWLDLDVQVCKISTYFQPFFCLIINFTSSCIAFES